MAGKEYAGFEECAVGRGEYGEMLTNLIKNSKDEELVIALNAAWGEGKTTFIQHWQKMLEAEKIPHICIDAFEHDHLDDAFFPIASTIYEYLEDNKAKETLKDRVTNSMASVGSKVGGFLLGVGKHTAGKYLGGEAVEALSGDKDDDLQNSAAKGFSKEFENQTDLAFNAAKKFIQSSKEDKENIDDLKKVLGDLYKSYNPEKDPNHDPEKAELVPFVIIIDELDRCRPDFALSILEKIKHLFSVPNVIFVLSMNGEQMERSIEHIYGQGINAKEYLDKFINIEFSLPKTIQDSKELFFSKILSHFTDRFHIHQSLPDYNGFSSRHYFTTVCKHFNLSLRDSEKIIKLLSFSIRMSGAESLKKKYPEYVYAYFIGAFLKTKDYALFERAIDGTLTTELFFEKSILPQRKNPEAQSSKEEVAFSYLQAIINTILKPSDRGFPDDKSILQYTCHQLSRISI